MSKSETESNSNRLNRLENYTVSHSIRVLIILAAVSIHSAALINAKPLQSANDRSRWSTVCSLVERGTFQIDEIRKRPNWDSIDIIYDGGHFYSTKPPLLTTIVAGLVWTVSKVTGWSLADDTHAVTTTILFLINILPFAVSLVLLNAILNRFANTDTCKSLVLIAAAFGTLLTPFLMTLNNHTVAATAVFLSLYGLIRIHSEEKPDYWTFCLTGFFASWACVNELPAAAYVLVAFLIAWRKSSSKALLAFVPCMVVPIIALIATNIIATGSWEPTYSSYGSSKYNFTIDGIPSYWANPQGVDRNLDSPWMYFLHSTIGHHGILSLSPIFLLSLIAAVRFQSIPNLSLRRLVQISGSLSLIVLGFYMTRTQNYNYGGVSCALRWALWLIPFWLISLIPIIDTWVTGKYSRWGTGALLSASIISAWLPVPNPWQQPWIFHLMEEHGWIDYSEEIAPFKNSRWTWIASLPHQTEGTGQATSPEESAEWVEYSSIDVDGGIKTIRMTAKAFQKDFVELKVERRDQVSNDTDVLNTSPSQPRMPDNDGFASPRAVFLDRKKFEAGAPPADFMRWFGSSVSTNRQQADLTFIRGLPLKQEFQPGVIRYLKTPLRQNAFRCQRAAAQVLFKNPVTNQTYRHRCDTWLNDEVPFGVVQFELQVTLTDTPTVVRLERWTISAASTTR